MDTALFHAQNKERGEHIVAKGKYQRWLEPDGLTLLEGWARDGLIDEQIAHNMGISSSTLRDWKNKYPAISAALKKGKEVVDLEVENALLKRALGYSYEEIVNEESGDGWKRRVTRKFVPPDTGAAIFWLKNRRPDKWREKPEAAAAAEAVGDDPLTRSLKEEMEE